MLKRCLELGVGRCLLWESVKSMERQPGLGLAVFPCTISKAISLLLEAKQAGNRRAVYLKSLAYYLRRFANGREEKPLADFSTAVIEAWLKQFPSASSRQTWLNRISTLFAFAVRRDLLQMNPCRKIERITIDHRPPSILAPAQVDLLLQIVPTICRPYLVLGLFAGIRPEELMKLAWSEIDLATKTVRVNQAKTRRRRIVPLEPRAAALLAACPLQRGPVSPSNVTVRRFKRLARHALKLEAWPKDVLRHTAASYLLALHKDVGRVAMMLGNSPNILMTHYHEPVNAADCAAFWKT